MSKLQLEDVRVKHILCTCSDDNVWGNRLRERFVNPTPNQLFRSVEEAKNYYDKKRCELLENEIIIDSNSEISGIIKEFLDRIV